MSNEALISFTGNATADAEIRFTPGGDAVANVTVAVTPRDKDQSGQWVDGQAAFYRVAAWKQLGENVGNSIRKGDRVTVVGKLKPREFEHNGEKRMSLDVTAESVALDLRFATATAQRGNSSGGGGGFQQQRPVVTAGAGQSNDPWAAQPQDLEPPF